MVYINIVKKNKQENTNIPFASLTRFTKVGSDRPALFIFVVYQKKRKIRKSKEKKILHDYLYFM
jgi:hypothetical protein